MYVGVRLKQHVVSFDYSLITLMNNSYLVCFWVNFQHKMYLGSMKGLPSSDTAHLQDLVKETLLG